MVRNYGKESWTFLIVWAFFVLFALAVNGAFLYLAWKLGWALIAWLSAH